MYLNLPTGLVHILNALFDNLRLFSECLTHLKRHRSHVSTYIYYFHYLSIEFVVANDDQ